MKYKLFGKSGLRVSEIALGTMTFGDNINWGSSEKTAKDIYKAFLEKGGNFIDTANVYTDGNSEKILGALIKPDRDKIVLSTKYSLSTDHKNPNASGNHRKNLVQSINHSLERLKTDYIDILFVHAWDNMTPVEEMMKALNELVNQGKVLYLAISDTPAWIISQANTIAELRGYSPFVSVQCEYSLLERTCEQEFIPLSQAFDLAITAWSPLAVGTLTGKYLNNENPKGSRGEAQPGWIKDYLTPKRNEIVKAVVDIAKKVRKTPAQVALRWLMQKPVVCIPIIGAKNVEQLNDNLGSADFELSNEDINKLNEVSQYEVGFPYAFLKTDHVRTMLYGDYYTSIENHHGRNS